MKRNKIFGYDLDLLIEEATKEAMAGLMDKEKIRQQQQQEKNKPFKASKRSQDRVDKDSEEEVEEGDEDTKDLKSPSNVAKNKLPEITIDSIINILNSLRSGKSLKDQQAKKDLKAYFTRLNGAERIALQAFLTGLDKILALVRQHQKVNLTTSTWRKNRQKNKKSRLRVLKPQLSWENTPTNQKKNY
jgi:citrate synthase